MNLDVTANFLKKEMPIKDYFRQRMENDLLYTNVLHSCRYTVEDSINIKAINNAKAGILFEHVIRDYLMSVLTEDADLFIKVTFKEQILEEEKISNKIASLQQCTIKTIEDSNKSFEKQQFKTSTFYSDILSNQIEGARDLYFEWHEATARNTISLQYTLKFVDKGIGEPMQYTESLKPVFMGGIGITNTVKEKIPDLYIKYLEKTKVHSLLHNKYN